MTNPIAVEADLDDFDPAADAADTPVELTLEQRLSRMGLRELQQEAKGRGLSGAGNTAQLVGRIVDYEANGGIIPEEPPMELKPGIAPAPTGNPPAAPAPGNAHLAPAATTAAPADVVPPASAGSTTPAARSLPSKTGFRPDMNTWRSELTLGPRGTIDDATHFQFIEDTHNEARQAGYRSKGAPHAGKRVGRSSISTGDGRRITTVIYEVSVRDPDYIAVEE